MNRMNHMTHEGWQARIEYDEAQDQFRGEILGLSSGGDFYGRTPQELREAFARTLAAYLQACEQQGMAPRKSYSGKFNLRIPPELHAQVALTAQAEGKSLNALVQEILQQRLAA